MAFVKIDVDECFVFSLNDSPRLVSQWDGELSAKELKDLRDCEKRFWAWQTRLEKFTRCKCDVFAMEHLRSEHCLQNGGKLVKSDCKKRKKSQYPLGM